MSTFFNFVFYKLFTFGMQETEIVLNETLLTFLVDFGIRGRI
jgi:hypothetical protein